MREDQEFKEFRDLMTVPDTFEEGVGWRSIIAALFVGLLMTPAQLYMQLVAGIEMGPAAQWVTVILYVEVARRAFTQLKRPEIFVLFYMCGAVIHADGGLLWRQFLVQSEEMRKLGIAKYIPTWYAPSDPAVLAQRSFLIKEWMVPLLLVILVRFLSRLDSFGLGYVMFRLTSDVEELPFPMAPVSGMGMTALADASSSQDTWRWRAFSIGGVAGIAFGLVYLAIPNITGAIFAEPIQILPLPFVDLTDFTEGVMPAVPVLVSFDVTFLVTGMVLPFWAMVGSFIGMVVIVIANPILYHFGLLPSWQPSIGGIQTIQANTVDFYFSFGLGLGLAVAAIGLYQVFSGLRKKQKTADESGQVRTRVDWSRLFHPPAGRGDFSIFAAIMIYVFNTLAYMTIAYVLINHVHPLPAEVNGKIAYFPVWLLAFYGFVYTPLMSYVSTRMEGIVGQQVSVPFVREASFILSGYKGASVWFAPIPLHDYARQAQFFRTTELTGTNFRSLIKAELLIFPIMLIGTVAFSQFIWQIDSVPSQLFPYANEFWELRAYREGLIYSATLPGEAASPFKAAFIPGYLAIGFSLATLLYAVLSRFGLPVFLVYGLIRGLDLSAPHAIVPMFIGAMLGRFVFRKRFGENWPRYRIVFAAGFTAGIGLITMLSLGIVFMSKSAIKLNV
ncbi:MAG: peptide transporter [Phycisphaerae bacterium]|nr:peptide transporter [Phycisphaerae bacterium]